MAENWGFRFPPQIAGDLSCARITMYADDNNETHNKTHENAARAFNDKNGISLSDYPTGNPILVLLIMILAMGTTQLRRFKK